jgi:hypothetical protein
VTRHARIVVAATGEVLGESDFGADPAPCDAPTIGDPTASMFRSPEVGTFEVEQWVKATLTP